MYLPRRYLVQKSAGNPQSAQEPTASRTHLQRASLHGEPAFYSLSAEGMTEKMKARESGI